MPNIKALLGFAVSFLFFYLAVRNVEWAGVLFVLKGIAPGFLFLTILFLFGSILIRAFLWKGLMTHKKKISWLSSFESIIIGYMGNNILPLRMGELMRAYVVEKKEGLSKSLVLASIILERLLDLLSLLFFFSALLLAMPLAEWLVLSGGLVFVFLVLMIILIYFLASDPGRLSSQMMKLFRYFPVWISEKAGRMVHSFIEGLALIKGKSQAVKAILLSLLSWFFMTLSFYFCMEAFGMALPLTAPLLLMVVLNIGVMIPSSPGFIGIFQYLCVVSLSFFAVSKESALAFSIILHASQYVPVTLLGWFYWARLHLSFPRSLQTEFEKPKETKTFNP